MSAIAAQPYDYELPLDSKVALVIIDMQRDFLEHGGFGEALGNDVTQLQSIIPTVKKLLETFRSLNFPVIHTIEAHAADLSDCPHSKLNRGRGNLKIGDQGSMGRILIVGEEGNNIISELTPLDNEIVIVKPGKGAFCRTNLEEILQKENITHLLFTGVTTEVCVQTTMREANDRGYECLLIEDGTASYFPEFKSSTIEMLRAQGGIIGWTAHAKKVIEALVS
ncbi:MAG: cysteine hydrolase family protein [Pseudanabaena sp.]|jgi:nicotinamidase-related amidase|nr:cysteine hydrolase [Pseudanabaena sp. M53BS1SP1A06MG]MCA6583360.1 cysteine hydrolase [Pseudanabaena sp. M34BS1SP1A06MG]MCA6586553.1 cysteine hydrolase [Pseudanabaena sp. M051S1SP1A06QC]MCA6588821.1 cysteine hydrolase [Pseudanabaena sp. M109S1SP1A06QC]MCA6593433.1 cysteine hydrolase [Pseudanabaena sp. M38BS1SP1A06MG]MCA6596104.1 cysteine hydrolase [Pseudanabaena sp. M046S1SP1A06QC]MCA6602305.1 cysteine hydrolase [Pseudanabaena sp. M57BS1SP1A06MG]MCA6605944.1 cysteine hydrolase [Pseudanabae